MGLSRGPRGRDGFVAVLGGAFARRRLGPNSCGQSSSRCRPPRNPPRNRNETRAPCDQPRTAPLPSLQSRPGLDPAARSRNNTRPRPRPNPGAAARPPYFLRSRCQILKWISTGRVVLLNLSVAVRRALYLPGFALKRLAPVAEADRVDADVAVLPARIARVLRLLATAARSSRR